MARRARRKGAAPAAPPLLVRRTAQGRARLLALAIAGTLIAGALTAGIPQAVPGTLARPADGAAALWTAIYLLGGPVPLALALRLALSTARLPPEVNVMEIGPKGIAVSLTAANRRLDPPRRIGWDEIAALRVFTGVTGQRSLKLIARDGRRIAVPALFTDPPRDRIIAALLDGARAAGHRVETDRMRGVVLGGTTWRFIRPRPA